MAKFATVQAIKDFVVASIKFLKVFRQWDKSWHYQPNDPCFYRGVGYCANPDNPPNVNEDPETYPTKWNIIGGAESGATFTPTPNRITKFDETARLRSGGYAIEPDHVIRKRELNLRVTTLQLYNHDSLLMSNARQVLRRQRGWDLGIPYLSSFGEIYHFDTDVLNQNQQSNILIEGNNLQLVGKNDILDVPLIPPIIGIPPHEVITKFLLGKFKITKTISASENSTFEFWVRVLDVTGCVVFEIGTPFDTVFLAIGLIDIEYSVPTGNDIAYCVAEGEDIPYSIIQEAEKVLDHRSPYKVESVSVDIDMKKWFHLAIINTKTKISVFIADKRFDFQKYNIENLPVTAVINKEIKDFNIDELYIDPVTALDFQAFAENTEARLPYAALDYREKWFVLEAEDSSKVKTNLFETQAFKTAVEAVIHK